MAREIIGGSRRSIIGELELIGANDSDYLDLLEGDVGAASDDGDLQRLLALVEGEVGDELDEDDIGEIIGAINARRRAGRGRGRRGRGGGAPAGARGRALVAAAVNRARAEPDWAQSVKGGGVAVRQQQPANARVLLLGGTATQGAVAGSLIVSTTAQELARVDRLFVIGVDAGGLAIPNALFLVSDIKVGTKSQFASVQPVPGVLFQADATGMGYALGLDTIQPGTNFSVIIANAPALSTFTFGTMSSAVR